VAVPSPLTGLIAGPGWPITAVLGGGGALAYLGGAVPAAIVLGVLALGNLAFFRNPRRQAPAGEHLLLAPADGKVVEAGPASDPDGFVQNAQRVAIFLSIFNVHVNSAPVSGKVSGKRSSGNKFLAAFNPDASARKVQSRLDVESLSGLRIGVAQITGLIARRIISYPEVGDSLERGEAYGLICYGSRMEVYLPAEVALRVKPGDRVRAGASVIGEALP